MNADQPLHALSLRVNFSWTFAGNVVNALCQWGVLAVLARAAGPTAVGQFGLGLAIAGPIVSISMLQLRTLLATDVHGEFTFDDYFGARIAWTILGLAIIGVVVWGSALEGQAAWVAILVGTAKCVDSLSDILRGLFQRMERMDYVGKGLMLRGIAALLVMGITLVATQQLIWAVASMTFTWLLYFLLCELVVGKRLVSSNSIRGFGTRLVPRFSGPTVLRISRLALPLGIVMSLISLQTNIPRYLLQRYVGEEGVGYFVALAYPMVAATMIATAMGQAALPRLNRHFVHDPAAFIRLLKRLTLLAATAGFIFVIGAFGLSKPILTLLYGPEYARYGSSFTVLAVATAVQMMASCAGYAVTAARYLGVQVVLVSVSCALTTIGGFWFVPRWGVWGGALSALVTSVSMLVLFGATIVWALRRRLAVNVDSASLNRRVDDDAAELADPQVGA